MKKKRVILWIAAFFTVIIAILVVNFLKHEMEARNERQSRPSPTEIHPIVAAKRDELIAKSAEKNISVIITDSYRSFDDQDALYAKGRTTAGQVVTYAKGGQSYHNFGLAIDFALITKDHKAIWDTEVDLNGNGESDWLEVVQIAKELGFTWGGDWRKFKDYPHLEMTFGLSLKELQKGWRPEDRLK